MEGWNKCILTYIDVIGVKSLADDSKGSSKMRKLHQLVTAEFAQYLHNHDHAYVWNDSVLIVAFLKNKRNERMRLLREVNNFKRRLDKDLNMQSFAIVVEGMAFPTPGPSPCQGPQSSDRSKVTVLMAASWAMANCFEIEKKLGKKFKKSWYIDSRITRKLNRPSRIDSRIKFYPKNKERAVSMYDDYLW